MAMQNLLDLEDEIVRDLTLDFLVKKVVKIIQSA
jgi:hypothetical protein